MKKTAVFFFVLAFLAGIIILAPYHNFQNVLSQGDHGHNLYCYKKTMDGALPYQDYYWPYGPLMPYYYALFLKLFGVSIQSVLLGKVVLNFMAGIFFYFAICALFPPALGFTAALWFWTHKPDFFFTYNHIGGITLSFVVIYFLFLYIKTLQRKYIWLGFLATFLFALVKLNFGISCLVALVASLLLTDSIKGNPLRRNNRILFILGAIVTISLTAMIYWALTRNLPASYVQQCLPYTGYGHIGQRLTSILSSCEMWFRLFILNFVTSWSDFFFNMILMLCALQSARLYSQNKINPEFKKNLLCILAATAIFYVLQLHEFFIGGPTIYRSEWMEPFKFLFVFILLGTVIIHSRLLLKSLLFGTLILICTLQVLGIYRMAKATKTPEHLFSSGKTKIYVNNTPEWIRVVQETTHYLKTNLKKDEMFFAFPNETLYYFLTGKDSPTRDLVFMSTGEEQEKEIISVMEKKKIDFFLLSNRADTQEYKMERTFGVTYGKILAPYLRDHFRVEASFGEWISPGGWILNHNTKILRRRN
ncbi:MAG TPA: hypothetical protein PL155_03335 [Candidatus Omnitrophota bacterium]|nr:hypothetical protein [Candidatus Omnitrophota bacterium]HPD84489.1 hypothetical protein [Candidatus Omnitrophota bacterium]HRZ03347.1 hypothetical protein [Candidatus Omnitrophota bacterium]